MTEKMNVVDFEIKNSHNYYANGRLNHNTTSGGRALGFHSSVRLMAKAVGQLKKGEDVIGIKTQVKVKKNRIGPPLRVASFDIFFNSGIDNYGSWISELKDLKIFEGTSKIVFEYDNESFEFKSKDTFIKLIESRPDVKEYLYKIICDANIMKYSKQVPEESDVTLDESAAAEMNE